MCVFVGVCRCVSVCVCVCCVWRVSAHPRVCVCGVAARGASALVVHACARVEMVCVCVCVRLVCAAVLVKRMINSLTPHLLRLVRPAACLASSG